MKSEINPKYLNIDEFNAKLVEIACDEKFMQNLADTDSEGYDIIMHVSMDPRLLTATGTLVSLKIMGDHDTHLINVSREGKTPVYDQPCSCGFSRDHRMSIHGTSEGWDAKHYWTTDKPE